MQTSKTKSNETRLYENFNLKGILVSNISIATGNSLENASYAQTRHEWQFWAQICEWFLRKLFYIKFWLCWNKTHSGVCRTLHSANINNIIFIFTSIYAPQYTDLYVWSIIKNSCLKMLSKSLAVKKKVFWFFSFCTKKYNAIFQR